jgi:HEAT repeat protein
MMDRIQSFGASARPNLLARLTDQRWYVIRNIIIMLRTITSEQDFEHLRPLLRHPNQRVYSEALRLLIILGDPVAQRQLLRDLDSADHETQLNAISMISRNSQPEIAQKLLAMLSGGGFNAVECELKSAAVQALGEMGKPEVLPELAKILASRSLLAFKALNRIKLDIIRSFERYPAQMAIPVLERLCGGGDDLARQAAESLKNLRSRTK